MIQLSLGDVSLPMILNKDWFIIISFPIRDDVLEKGKRHPNVEAYRDQYANLSVSTVFSWNTWNTLYATAPKIFRARYSYYF